MSPNGTHSESRMLRWAQPGGGGPERPAGGLMQHLRFLNASTRWAASSCVLCHVPV